MSENKPGQSGNKYHRRIIGVGGFLCESINVDVYSVIQAFRVTNAGSQHAIKKILCAGLRDKGSEVQDIQEAIDALHRALDFAKLEEEDGE